MARARRRSHRVGFKPYGLGEQKPNHYAEMLRTVWQNRRHPLYTWRILRDGVCDGCALGTTGLRDFTMDGIHLCTVRLNLLPLNTMDALDPNVLADVRRLDGLTSRQLRDLGRLPSPMLRRNGEPGYTRIPWDAAIELLAGTLRATDPRRLAIYLTSRGITNEVYYAAQKSARFLGTNNIDNAARLCHAASTVGMKHALGVSASTVSYKDWIGADLIVFLGSNVANNQPVTTKYLVYAKRAGTKVAMVNAFREPGMMRYWVPSVTSSALFGTTITDEYWQVHTGGDLAFLNGTLKSLVEHGGIDTDFISAHTTGWDALRTAIGEQDWDALEASSGASRAEMERFARLLIENPNTIFVWSMGLTQHRHGVDTVKALMNLALARGAIGRAHAGVMPIRGHSGVQGGAEVGCVPNTFPGGVPVDPEGVRLFDGHWGFEPPATPGLTTAEMVEAAYRGDIDLLWSAGGNFLETMPEPAVVGEAIARVPHRVHQDIVLTSQMLIEPRDWSLILPARTRYEQEGGGTETTTERQIIYSPQIPGPRPGEARSEWKIFTEVAAATYPDRAHQITFDSAADIRAEIARTVPAYAGIERLAKKGDHVQWGGRLLCEHGRFPTDSGRARFSVVTPPERALPDGAFLLSTRRGKQFNSMVHTDVDPLTGAGRDHVFIARPDAAVLGVDDDEPVVVRSRTGEFRGRARLADIRPRNVQIHWPEAQVLLERGVLDPQCGVPDYNAIVHLELGRSHAEPPADR